MVLIEDKPIKPIEPISGQKGANSYSPDDHISAVLTIIGRY